MTKVGHTLTYFQGNFRSSLAHCDQVVALYDVAKHGRLVLTQGGVDQGVAARGWRAWNLWHLGYPDQALQQAVGTIELAESLAHPFSIASALFTDTFVNWFCGLAAVQRDRAEQVIALSERHGFPLWLGLGKAFLGSALVSLGVKRSAVAEVSEGLALAAGTGNQAAAPGLMALLAEVQYFAGEYSGALQTLDGALVVSVQTGQRFWDAELHRLKGDVELATRPENIPGADAMFRRAIDVARSQEAKSFELRAATSLARLLRMQGTPTEARALLGPIYAWFSEGLETRDLVEAKKLLDEL